MTDKPTPEQIQQEAGMTLDEATGIWMASFNAWCEHPLPANERVAREAAATVIQQAFAEREVGMIEALKPFAHYYRLNDCEGRPDDDAIEVPIGDLRLAALALAAKGDSRG